MPRKWNPSDEHEPEQVAEANAARELAQAFHDLREAEANYRETVKELHEGLKAKRQRYERLAEEIVSGQRRLI